MNRFVHKIRYVFLAALIVAGFVLPVQAAGGRAMISLGNVPDSIALGEKIEVPVFFEPNGEKIDTVRIMLSYDEKKLIAKPFVFSAIFPYKSPGNFATSGEVSAGAFRLGGSAAQAGEIGRVIFTAQEPGAARIALNSESLLLSVGEQKWSGNLNSKIAERIIRVRAKNEPAPVTPPKFPEGIYFTLSSPSHPDDSIWSVERRAVFAWDALPGVKPQAVLFAFDRVADTDPKTALPESAGVKNRMVFDELADGIWYFHLKAMGVGGQQIIHRRINVDATSPAPFQINVEPTEAKTGVPIQLSYAAVDENSGVARYVVQFGNREPINADNPYEFSVEAAGEYQVRVIAVDAAGNEREAAGRVVVVGESVKSGNILTRVKSWVGMNRAGVLVFAVIVGGAIFVAVRRKRMKDLVRKR